MSALSLWNLYQQLLVAFKQVDGTTNASLHAAISAALLQCKADLIDRLETEPVVPSAALTST